MISAPFQYNYDQKLGADEKGSKHVLNIQPVIPMFIGADWNVISRTIIVSLVDQHNVADQWRRQVRGGRCAAKLFLFAERADCIGHHLGRRACFRTAHGLGQHIGLR